MNCKHRQHYEWDWAKMKPCSVCEREKSMNHPVSKWAVEYNDRTAHRWSKWGRYGEWRALCGRGVLDGLSTVSREDENIKFCPTCDRVSLRVKQGR